MQNTDYLIIGGGVSGVTAAETIRNEDAGASITIVQDEIHPLYSRVQIPYYLTGIKTREQIFLRDLASYAEKKINVLTQKVAEHVDPTKSVVTTQDGEEISYKKLLITTGGKPRKLGKYTNEYHMQTVEDADKILSKISQVKNGVVIGSGFIALEFIEMFLHYKIPVSLCVSKEGFWEKFLSKEASQAICKDLTDMGVSIFYGNTPEISQTDDTMVGVGIGLELKRNFFEEAGIKFDMGIVTDGNLKTNVPNIFASGDIAKFYSHKLEREVRYGNWTNALVSGKYAGLNMTGKNEIFDVLSAYSIKCAGQLSIVFLGFAGIDEFTQVKTKVISEKECIQFFIRKGKLDGCVLINRSIDRATYQKIIESREDFNL